MSQLILDAGAFVAFERGDVNVRALLAAVRRVGLDLATTSPVVAQIWRDGRRQALMARLVRATRVDAPNEEEARRAGELLARTKTSDVIDALLIELVHSGDSLLTSDSKDMRRLLFAAGREANVISV